MKRTFTVHNGGRETSVTEHHTVRTKAELHRRFNRTMQEALKEMMPDSPQINTGVIHLMTPEPSWGVPSHQMASQSHQEASGLAFDSPLGGLSPEIRKRLKEA